MLFLGGSQKKKKTGGKEKKRKKTIVERFVAVANESMTRFCSNSAANNTLFVFAHEQKLRDTK
jgi:hypothetical protein